MRKTGFLPFALLAILTAGCSRDSGADRGQPNDSEGAAVGTSGAADLVSQDAREFIHHVDMVNRAEIDLGRLAATRGASDEVKQFAQMMIDDHTASSDRLAALASELQLGAPDQTDDTHGDLRDTLARREGADFDREYASTMVDGHEELIDQLEPRIDKKTLDPWKDLRRKTKDPGAAVALLPDPGDNPTTMRINQFAVDLYPTVYAHLEAARVLENSLERRSATP